MAYTQGLCPKIQMKAIDLFANNAPVMKRRKLGFIQAITSSLNTSGVQMIQPDGGIPGKKRGVQINFMNPVCFDTVRQKFDCVTPGNNTEVQPIPLETVYDVASNPWVPTNTVSGKPQILLFDEDEMRKLCENDAQQMTEMIMLYIGQMAEGMDKAMLGQFASMYGENAAGTDTGTTPEPITLFKDDGTGVLNPLRQGHTQILAAYEDILATGMPIVVGNGKIRDYNRELKFGCCNNNGVNMDITGDWAFFQDQFFESVNDTDQFAVFAPGAVQLVSWSKYKGREKSNDIFSRGTIVDPITGLEFDLKIMYDYNCEKWRVEIMKWADLVSVMAGACGMPDVNSILLMEGTTLS
jgi:hypothetical protein